MRDKEDSLGQEVASGPSSVLLLAPDMYGTHGGVQAYMRMLAEILFAYGIQRGMGLDCISLADRECNLERHSCSVSYNNFIGAHGSKSIFTQKAILLTLRRAPEVVVVGHPGLVPSALVLKVLGLARSYILVLHGGEAWQRLHWLDRLASRRASWVVSTTRYTAQEFCRYNGVSLEQPRIIPLAIADAAVDHPFSRSANGGGELKVLTVSRLVGSARSRYKGIDTLIDAVARARAANTPISLTIAGDGDDVQRLRERVASLGLARCVSFRGAVGDCELRYLYRECDVFAMPSKVEGFGIVFLEAMREGKPCIGGNHGGTPEVIDDRSDGFLVEHGDVDRLAQCLVELSGNPALRNEMGKKAREKVIDRFLLPRMRDNWFSLLDETLSASRSQSNAILESDPVRAGSSRKR